MDLFINLFILFSCIYSLLFSSIFSHSLVIHSVHENKVTEITEKLSRSLWIGTSTNPCALTRALFMDVCRHWWEGAFPVKPDDLSSLMVEAKSVVDEFFMETPFLSGES